MGFDYLMHVGTPHVGPIPHSGRYKYGSGGAGMTTPDSFLAQVREMKKQGMSETEIYKKLGMNSSQYRAKKSIAIEQELAINRSRAVQLRDKGYSNVEIGRLMGVSEGTIRNYLKPTMDMRMNKNQNVADELKRQVDEKRYLDIGKGVEVQLGITETRLKTAVAMLEEEGYKKQYLKVPQATNPGKDTRVKVLTKEDVTWEELKNNRDKIMTPKGVYFEDNGMTMRGIKPPISINSDRIKVCYAEDGGIHKDGVIEIRPGVEDISLGQNQYAQVRIAVDKTHYLKGMAMYSNDIPDGYDMVFNTNKHVGTPKCGEKDNTVLKRMDDDPDNPFGATVRQFDYTTKSGEKKQSPINIVNEDADWDKWSKNLSSQFLSKQKPLLAKRQLELAYKEKEQEFKDILAVTNPAVRKKLLLSFSDDCDASAVDLKAAPLPGQKTHVILPLTKIKDNEVYAPNYKTGDEVILVRYPHAGIFEIPRLTVNNNNPQGQELLKQSKNAIGINSNVAERLSGADFDGDTVIVIPTKNQNLRTSAPLKDLVGFDPKERYSAYPGMPKVGPKTDGFHKQAEMGKVSNLITDMTIKGATEPELARAVKHSMVVIDAEKHNLDWRRSFEENRIAQLKETYQGGKNAGASTLISMAKSKEYVNQRKDYIPERDIDPITGKKTYRETGEEKTIKKILPDGSVSYESTGEKYKEASTKMAERSDARALSSGSRIEEIYANHANKLKALGNQARKEYLTTPKQESNPEAKKKYKDEVDSLNEKLNNSKMNAPRERQAQLIANKMIQAKRESSPYMDKDEYRKMKAQTLEGARMKTGAALSSVREARKITITPREWEAIQAGAVSHTKLLDILDHADMDVVREYATPRNNKYNLLPATKSRAKAMLNAGYTQKEVAEACNVSLSSISELLNAAS